MGTEQCTTLTHLCFHYWWT